MKKMKQDYAYWLKKTEVRLGIFLLLGLLLTWVMTPHVSLRVITSGETQPSDYYPAFPQEKPWYRAKAGEMIDYLLTLDQSNPAQITRFRLLPDDCLQSIIVNGVQAFKSRLPTCNYASGIALDFAPYLKPGQNTINILVMNQGGAMGLDFYVDFLGSVKGLLLSLYWATLWFSAVYVTAQKLVFSVPAKIALMASMLLIVIAGDSFSYEFNAHDLGAHIDHIAYLYTHWWRTDPFLHSGFRYPSTYHLLLSLLSRAGNAMDLGGLPWRVCSLLFYTVFLFAGVKILEKTFATRRQKDIAQCIFLLWPLHFILAWRVNNDVPFYAFCTLALLALVHYAEKGTLRLLTIASGLVSLALIIKFNALMLGPAIIFALYLQRKTLIKNLRAGWRKERITLVLLVAMPLVALGVGPFYSFYKVAKLPYDPGIYGAQGLGGKDLYAPNTASAYALPSISHLLDVPFVAAETSAQKQNIWGYLLRTSVFGEFSYSNYAVARVIIAALSLMTIYVLVYYLTLNPNDLIRRPALSLGALFLFSCVMGVIFFRAQYNQIPSQDFRYIVPALVPFISAWLLIVERWQRKGLLLLSGLGYASGITLVIFGYIFYLQFFISLR